MKNKHNQALEFIINNPDIICARKPLFMAKEVNFYKRNSDDLISQPDLIAFDGVLYILEYKSSEKHRDKAIKQLQTSLDFVRETLNYNGIAYTIFMHDNPFTKEIIESHSSYTNKHGKVKQILRK